MKKAEKLIRKEVKRVAKENTSHSADEILSFSVLHEQVKHDFDQKRALMDEIAVRVANERDMMKSLAEFVVSNENNIAHHNDALAVDTAWLSDPPFLAKTCIFARLCDARLKVTLRQLSRVQADADWTRAEQLATECAQRLRVCVRNVIHGDDPKPSNHQDVTGKQDVASFETYVQSANSQLAQDIQSACRVEWSLLRQGRDAHKLLALTRELLRQRSEAEDMTERLCDSLGLLKRNFVRTKEDHEKRSSSSSSSSSSPALLHHVDDGKKTFADFLTMERARLTELVTKQATGLRSLLDQIQKNVEKLRQNMASFVECIISGTSNGVSTDSSDYESSSVECNDFSVSIQQPQQPQQQQQQQPQQQPSSSSTTSSSIVLSSCGMDEDVRFWLQLKGLSRYQHCFIDCSWDKLKMLKQNDLRSRRLGVADATRIAQMLLRVDESDWSHVLMSGWMRKRGEGPKAGWRKRFFVFLSTTELLYFKSDTATQAQGSLFLSNVSSVRKEGRFVWLETKTRVYELDFEGNTADMAKWTELFEVFGWRQKSQ